MVDKFGQFSPAEQRVAFPPDLFRLPQDDVVGNLERLEHQGGDFNRRFKFFRNNFTGSEFVQFFEFLEIPGPDDDVNRRVQTLGKLNDPPCPKGVGNRNHEDFGIFNLDLVQDRGIGGVAILNGDPRPDFQLHHFPPNIQDDVGNLELSKEAREIAAVQAVSHDDNVVPEFELGRFRA